MPMHSISTYRCCQHKLTAVRFWYILASSQGWFLRIRSSKFPPESRLSNRHTLRNIRVGFSQPFPMKQHQKGTEACCVVWVVPTRWSRLVEAERTLSSYAISWGSSRPSGHTALWPVSPARHTPLRAERPHTQIPRRIGQWRWNTTGSMSSSVD